MGQSPEPVLKQDQASSSLSNSGDDPVKIRNEVSGTGKAELDVSRDETVAVAGGGAVSKGDASHPGSDGRSVRKLLGEEEKLSPNQKLQLLKKIATVKDDGTVEFEIPTDVELGALEADGEKSFNAYIDDLPGSSEPQYLPPLQIVILIVGTRGDVQPFIAIGKRLQEYGHRVRLATHANFKEFVITAGLEFYPLGGDPKVLVEYMVMNKGFLPSGLSEIQVQRAQMKEIIFSLLAACKEPDLDSGIPFKADAMMANPPAHGHTHVAEALKIPIHIFSTMPWTPTGEFPHPLSYVKQPAGYGLSYQIVDSIRWLGIRDMINDLRKKKLKLRPVTYLSGSQGSETDIPHCYIWSRFLVRKPKDWGPKIDVVGFCFLDLASNYKPPEELVRWLEAGPKPIYIGFGSLPVQEPEKMTQTIVEALEMTGQRGIINKGWGGLGILTEPKDFVYSLDNIPHDWLFLQCASVVHHGGAGTTAAGLKAACPTTIVPFFGDQPFWGEQVHGRGVGPPPIPVDQFNLTKLVDAIKFMLDPKVKERAVQLAKAMENEDGVEGAVEAFLRHLPQLIPDCKPPSSTEPPKHSTSFSIFRYFGSTKPPKAKPFGLKYLTGENSVSVRRKQLERHLIPLEEIKLATNNFSRDTWSGEGGFGTVYKGQLRNCTVAIKSLNTEGHQGYKEFDTELKLISSFRHDNIIPFVGYCNEDNHMIIVTEYATNHSLDHHLQDPKRRRCLTWAHRLNICLGAARGLSYLHLHGVIHRDIKSGNILLDENMRARICDFGLSRLRLENGQQVTHIYTKAAGTNFYLDPCYQESGILRSASDVYSFGVVLFEILSGRLAYSTRSLVDGTLQPTLIKLVRRHEDDHQFETLVDPSIANQIDSRCLNTLQEIAYKCISLTPKERPTMEIIFQTIEDAMYFQLGFNL